MSNGSSVVKSSANKTSTAVMLHVLTGRQTEGISEKNHSKSDTKMYVMSTKHSFVVIYKQRNVRL